jgi:hypothetical protein
MLNFVADKKGTGFKNIILTLLSASDHRNQGLRQNPKDWLSKELEGE